MCAISSSRQREKLLNFYWFMISLTRADDISTSQVERETETRLAPNSLYIEKFSTQNLKWEWFVVLEALLSRFGFYVHAQIIV